jgi:hypothetical protein
MPQSCWAAAFAPREALGLPGLECTSATCCVAAAMHGASTCVSCIVVVVSVTAAFDFACPERKPGLASVRKFGAIAQSSSSSSNALLSMLNSQCLTVNALQSILRCRAPMTYTSLQSSAAWCTTHFRSFTGSSSCTPATNSWQLLQTRCAHAQPGKHKITMQLCAKAQQGHLSLHVMYHTSDRVQEDAEFHCQLLQPRSYGMAAIVNCSHSRSDAC